MIYPYMLYGILAWGKSNSRNINKIKSLQRKILKLFPQHSTQLNKLLTFDNIYSYSSIIKMFTDIHKPSSYFHSKITDLLPSHPHTTRHSSQFNFNLPDINLTQFKASFLYNGIKNWNTLPSYIKNIENKSKLKKTLKLHLINQ